MPIWGVKAQQAVYLIQTGQYQPGDHAHRNDGRQPQHQPQLPNGGVPRGMEDPGLIIPEVWCRGTFAVENLPLTRIPQSRDRLTMGDFIPASSCTVRRRRLIGGAARPVAEGRCVAARSWLSWNPRVRRGGGAIAPSGASDRGGAGVIVWGLNSVHISSRKRERAGVALGRFHRLAGRGCIVTVPVVWRPSL